MADAAVSTAPIQQSIDERVRGLGSSLKTLRPTAMLVVLAGAALWPIAAPLVGTGAAVGVAGGIMGLLGGPGQAFISDFLRKTAARGRKETASRDGLRSEFERELLERLQAGDATGAALREDVGRLLKAVDGIEIALAAAERGAKEALALGLAELSEAWDEFGWMLGEVQAMLAEIQARQAETLALQRTQLDLQREQLVKTNVLLRVHRQAPPLLAPGDGEPVLVHPAADGASPYKGLEPFQPEDAEFFCGREKLVAELLARLVETRFLAVVGASGSGKSSLVRAGLAPALWAGRLPGSEGWRVVILTPGPQPLGELALRVSNVRDRPGADLQAEPRALGPLARHVLRGGPGDGHLVVIVDQAEELFTLCSSDADRDVFLDVLLDAATAPEGRSIIVITVRADFVAHLAAHPKAAAALQDNQVLVGPMRREEFEAVIVEPARRGGLSLEPGLVGTLMDDLGGEPGALPLLSHALRETWLRRRGRTLTIRGYLESGRIPGAIARTADTVFLERLTATERAIARRVFLRLTEIVEGAGATRRRASVTELIGRPREAPAVRHVLDVLANARLVTVGEGTVEVAHEALIRHWPTLRRWLAEDAEGQRIHRHLAAAAREWVTLGREPGALYRGARLDAADDWAVTHDEELNELEREFLEESRAAERHELETAMRQSRRFRAVSLGLAVLLIVAAGAAALAVRQTQQARAEERAAEEQARVATSRRLAAEAVDSLRGRYDLAVLLSLEALRIEPTAEARSALIRGLQWSPRLVTVLRPPGGATPGGDLVFSADGAMLATAGSDGAVTVWDVARARPAGAPLAPRVGRVESLAFSPEGRMIASGDAAGFLTLWATDRPTRPTASFRGHRGAVIGVGFSRDGKTLVSAGADDVVRIWGVDPSRPLGTSLRIETDELQSLALAPGARTVAVGDFGGTITLWDVRRRSRVDAPLTGHRREVLGLAFSPDGRTLASASADGTVRLWDLGRARPARRPLVGHDGEVVDVALGPNGRLASAGADGTVRLWDVARGRPAGPPLRGHEGRVRGVAFSPDGATLASTGADGTARLWEVRRPRMLATPLTLSGEVADIAFSSDGQLLVSAGADGTVRVWDVRRRASARPPLAGGGQALSATFSPDGKTVVSVGSDGVVRVWDVRTGQSLGAWSARGDPDLLDVAFAPDGTTLASAGSDGSVILWRVGEGRPHVTPLAKRGPAALAVAFSSEGTLASARSDGAVTLWDIRRRRSIGRPLRHPGGPVVHVAFSSDGKILASAGAAGTIRLWDVSRGQALAAPFVHGRDGVRAVAFSADGRTLVSGAADGTVKLWDVPRRRALGAALVHGGGRVQSVAFSRDGIFASAGIGILLWDRLLSSQDLASWRGRLCGMVGRSVTEEEWSEFLPDERYRPTCPRQ